MAKKLTLPFAMLAIVAALAVPATAAAEDVLLPVGTTIRISSGTTTIKSSLLGTISCGEMTWQGVLNENGGKLLIKEMPGSAKECTANGTKAVVMNSTEIKPTKIEEGEVGHGTVHLAFNATIEGILVCKWEGSGSFTYTKGTDEAAFAKIPVVGTAGCGTGSVSGQETDRYLSGAELLPVKWL